LVWLDLVCVAVINYEHMQNNAYILERTMNRYKLLKFELLQAGFNVKKEKEDEDIMVTVTKDRLDSFVSIVRKYLDEPFNYVDIKFPDDKLTIIAFRERTWEIDSSVIDEDAKKWAISIGLPTREATWATFY